MAYEINEAKALVIEAGKKLVESGLIARTWGNVSARISDTQFVITPSGRPYETLTPDELVVVNIADCEYEGDIKPSSEKGVHADAYRLRENVNFVIHTHQVNASAISPTGRVLKDLAPKYAKVLGPKVPVGAYGMPSTGALRKGVAAAVEANPDCKAIIMKHHGALCLGEDFDESFAVAAALEDVCGKELGRVAGFTTGNNRLGAAKLYKAYEQRFSTTNNKLQDLGSSKKITDKTFELTMKNGDVYSCNIESGCPYKGIGPRCAAIHAAIYRNSDVTFIDQYTADDVVAISKAGNTMKPHLDDFAQIAGVDVKCCNWEKTSYRTDALDIGKASKGRNAVLVKGQGAMVTGNTLFDLEGVKKVLEKECKAEMYCELTVSKSPLSPIDTNIMRVIYNLKYSKQAEK